ncbi:MAG: helix-turn-helix domain-containing protein [Dehalococcoidia bacterium]|jgi:transcriptional regulator with XRE-family HTH domain|nr:helix-turn-helix domain-containing protein [Dehalococcoidia bacterium]
MLTRQTPPPDFKWQADNIRALRTHLGLSQTVLSRELGIRQQTISEWETGMYEPRGASVTILTLLAVSSNFPFERESTDEPSMQLMRSEQSAARSTPGFTPRRAADSGPARPGSGQDAPAQRLTFEAAKAAQTVRRTGTYNTTYFESRPSASVGRTEIPM